MKDKTRYFVIFNREETADNINRFWTHRSGDNYVTCFHKDGTKGRANGYTDLNVLQHLKDKRWKEITEAEAALL